MFSYNTLPDMIQETSTPIKSYNITSTGEAKR